MVLIPVKGELVTKTGERLARRSAVALGRLREGRSGISDGDASEEGRGRTALVTGGSSGIGWSMCELLAAKGYDVVPVARREERLRQLAEQLEKRWSVRVDPLPCDLGEPGAASYIRDELERRGIAVDFLVNNAGYSVHGRYLENSWAEHLQYIRVMAVSVAELSYYLLPHMVEKRWGRLINISSVGALGAGSPGLVLYSATKSFVLKFSEGLAADYEPFGVHCTASVAGATDTELMRTPEIWEYVSKNLLVQLSLMRPETVVRQAYDACMAGRRVIVNGWPAKIWGFTVMHSPPPVRYRLMEFNAKMTKGPS